MPWARTGPGVAWDGRPKFDLTQFDPSYFSRLRSRVAAAGKMGVYTSVMLFEGLCMHTFACLQGSNILGHPFDGPNNINGIDINTPEDVQSLGASEAVLNLEKAYIRKVVDTVHDEDNVLFEVADEALPSSNEWQDWVISYVRQYEQEKGYEMHPIGKTQQVGPPTPGPEVLFNSPADWVSPATGGDYLNDPPASDGTKVVIADADHYAPCGNTPLSGWKAFVRGLNPIMLDCAAANPTNPGTNPAFQSDAEQELSRVALGDTRRLAQSLDLAKTTPRGDLSSTGFALANPGSAYVVVQPEEAPHSTLSVTLERGVYWLRWFSIADREWRPGGLAIVIKKTMTRSFQSPFGTTGPTVLDIRGL
jgi:hypothetical protein